MKPPAARSPDEEVVPTVALDEAMEKTEAPPAGEEDTEGSGTLEKEEPAVSEHDE